MEAETKVKSTQDRVIANVFVENLGVTTDYIITLASGEFGFKFAG